MKLGQILIDEGLIDAPQLQRALDAQLIYGGHLGTCLIELGLLSEAQLGEVLSKSFSVPYAEPSQFHAISRGVVAKLPAALAERHAAIPLSIEDNVLTVALIDPRNLQALDELSFACGHRVEPRVAPEARIFQALERYYDVPRRTRYVSLCNRLDQFDAAAFPVERLDRDVSQVRAAPIPGFTAAPNAGAASVASATETQQPISIEDPLADLAERMSGAEHRDQLARMVLAWCGRDLARRVLFKLARGQARVWTAAGGELEDGHRDEAVFDVIGHPTFALMRGSDVFCGPLDHGEDHAAFFQTLGMRPSSDALLVPIHLNDRLVGVLYGDAGPDEAVSVDPALYRRVARKLALGLSIDLLRSRMRTV